MFSPRPSSSRCHVQYSAPFLLAITVTLALLLSPCDGTIQHEKLSETNTNKNTDIGTLNGNNPFVVKCQQTVGKDRAALCDPESFASISSPEIYRVRFETTTGRFHITVNRTWAPNAADRFYNLARLNFFTNNYYYRVLPDWVAQWGASGIPELDAIYAAKNQVPGAQIDDDPAIGISNVRGTVAFGAEYNKDESRVVPRTRATETYINYRDNSRLDPKGFTPFGIISEVEMTVVDAFYAEYGEMTDVDPKSKGITWDRLLQEGNAYLETEFPYLDYIRKASLITDPHGDHTPTPGPRPSGTGYIAPLIIIGFAGVLVLAVVIGCVRRTMHARKARQRQDFELLDTTSAGPGGRRLRRPPHPELPDPELAVGHTDDAL